MNRLIRNRYTCKNVHYLSFSTSRSLTGEFWDSQTKNKQYKSKEIQNFLAISGSGHAIVQSSPGMQTMYPLQNKDAVFLVYMTTSWITDNSAQRQVGPGQLGPKKSAQDNSAQVVPISEDNSAQTAPTSEDLSAHENQTRHFLIY